MIETYTREEMSEQLAMTGKELTAILKEMLSTGRLAYDMHHYEPTKSNKKCRRYWVIPQTVAMNFNADSQT